MFLVRANFKPFLALTKMFAFSAGGIGGAFAIYFITTASILHHRDERLAIFGKQRFSDKVRIDDCRLIY